MTLSQPFSISTWLLLGVNPSSLVRMTSTHPAFAGGYAFITNMIPLHALTLTLMGRFTNRLYVGYSSWYAIGTLASMQVPFVGFQPVRTSEHMGALGMSNVMSDIPCQSIFLQVSSVFCR